MRRPGQALFLLRQLQRAQTLLLPSSAPSTHGPILHLALERCSQEQLSPANTCGLRSFVASCAPCSNHRGSHDSVQGPPSSSSHGTASQPSAAGDLGRVKPMLAMMYTCGKCGTRSMKTFSHQAFKHGVVLIRCPSCQSLHLVADNLGWFGERGWTVERLMAKAQGLGSAMGQESRNTHNVGATRNEGSSDGPSVATSGAPEASSEGGSYPSSSGASSCPPADQGMITDADMEGYHKVQQLFEVAMRSQGAGGQHSDFRPEELSVMEVSEEDFKAWAAVMKSKQQL